MMQTASAPNTEEIKARCLKIIDGFRHRDAIREDDVREWVSTVVGEHGEAATWHATRAGGFGGSDIGILVRNFEGFRADHQASAHDIVASKLLRSVPTEETCDMRRGHANEPRHAEFYYAKYGARRDQEAFDRLTKATGLRSWMRYSPDDVILQPALAPNQKLGGLKARRLLIDYKAPRRVEEDESIAFQYSCQLHQGAMICAAAGIHLDGLQLSQFDWAGWELKDDYVAYDTDLARMILVAGDHYYDHVRRGEVPSYIMTPELEDSASYVAKYGLKAQSLAQISAMAKAFTKEAEAIAEELKGGLKGVRLAGRRLNMGDLTVSAVALVDHDAVAKLLTAEEAKQMRKKSSDVSYDVDAMVAKLRELNVDVKAFRKHKIDGEKAFALLVDKGHDAEQLIVEQIRMGVSNFLTEQAKDLVASTYPRIVSKEVAEEVAANDGAVEGAPVAAVEAQPLAANDATPGGEAETNVRDGEFTVRLAPRTVSA